ncbi:amidohydrolase family protein [Neolewinella antarctica]|uniref:Imidazolonepropionase-like amidohydrolase n=1 Tax=Neolewinella antarctica TaxID=442734 RepID=A0ABX0XGA6_9BACT|nr:amidohydrolase family protein [Neolewinella antarctica]NJC28358.1 imidazolonepropionase-like amidohydrolase [Neolewinella antarctica]
MLSTKTNHQARVFAFLTLLFTVFLCTGVRAQQTYPYNGVYDQRDGHYAFTNATIHVSPTRTIENGTLIIRRGKIVSVGSASGAVAGAVEVDLKGKHIYPSFIEPYGSYGMPEVKASEGSWNDPPQLLSNKDGAFSWNEALRSETDAAAVFTINKEDAKALREAGFGFVSTHHHDGISRGTAAVVSTAETTENEVLIKTGAAHHLSFSKGSSKQNYPTSRMGAMALLRQTYLDADWYGKQRGEETNLSIQAWTDAQDLPQIFEVDNWQDALRADLVGDEFSKQYVIKGGGDEFERLPAIKASGATLILPVTFPEAYDVTDPFAADIVTLGQLRQWERAPGNAAAVAEAGIPFMLTTDELKKMSDFAPALRKAIKAGLTPEQALAALTTSPAELLGISEMTGTLENGKLASFFITDKDYFSEEKAAIYQHWVQGNPYAIKDLEMVELEKEYRINVGNKTYVGKLSGEAGSQKMKVTTDSDTTGTDAKLNLSGGLISLAYQPKGEDGFYRLSGLADANGTYSGTGRDPQGKIITWSATPTGGTGDKDDEDKDDKESNDSIVGKLTYPNIAYGMLSQPQTGSFLIRNATVWTNESEGILENADVLIVDGKISGVGTGLNAGRATVIDGTGKHVTSGVIDEHSHIALTSVNESAQASSAEVRMEDVVDANDENIYRQLAGGVTVSQLLHGSANPIGGQSAIIKLRWGKTADEMLFEGADPFIKFALGENVKQSNWGDANRVRYPQTRMGVEQVFESYFSRAKEYGENVKAGRSQRRDLELETLLEILNSERFISCHSYQQGEINMLMKVAEKFGFRVNTFTHILEGYKVADKMAEHGAAGSTFSDWWAYKYEVNEAIPYNGAIMHEQGVLTAFNSDDAEMARRLNQESAKAVLFGGVSEEDAWKFVTLNPAKMLHLDDRVGSLKAGKDADVVVWSDHPMSIYAKAERTFVDGIEYFNRERDEELRGDIAEERNALIQKSLAAKNGGDKTQKPEGKMRRMLHCDSLEHSLGGHSH